MYINHHSNVINNDLGCCQGSWQTYTMASYPEELRHIYISWFTGTLHLSMIIKNSYCHGNRTSLQLWSHNAGLPFNSVIIREKTGYNQELKLGTCVFLRVSCKKRYVLEFCSLLNYKLHVLRKYENSVGSSILKGLARNQKITDYRPACDISHQSKGMCQRFLSKFLRIIDKSVIEGLMRTSSKWKGTSKRDWGFTSTI